MSNVTIHTEIEISASAERVWQVLTDLAAYHEWNPMIRLASGNMVHLVHDMTFHGLLIPLIRNWAKKATYGPFVKMNRALKDRAEK